MITTTPAYVPTTITQTEAGEKIIATGSSVTGIVDRNAANPDDLINCDDASIVDLANPLALKQQRTAEESRLLESHLNDNLKTPDAVRMTNSSSLAAYSTLTCIRSTGHPTARRRAGDIQEAME